MRERPRREAGARRPVARRPGIGIRAHPAGIAVRIGGKLCRPTDESGDRMLLRPDGFQQQSSPQSRARREGRLACRAFRDNPGLYPRRRLRLFHATARSHPRCAGRLADFHVFCYNCAAHDETPAAPSRQNTVRSSIPWSATSAFGCPGRGSSVGESVGFITRRSGVQIPPASQKQEPHSASLGGALLLYTTSGP